MVEVKQVLTVATKYSKLLKHLKDLDQALVLQTRLADPQQEGINQLLLSNQAKQQLLGELNIYIESLEYGTEHLDPNTDGDFLRADPTE